jgi:hypothetical protein
MFGGLAGRQAEDTLHFPLVNSTKWGTPQPNVACVDVYCSVCTSGQIETMIHSFSVVNFGYFVEISS